jgi:hypothetical protein
LKDAHALRTATSIDIIHNAWSTPLDPRIEPERAWGDFTNSRAITTPAGRGIGATSSRRSTHRRRIRRGLRAAVRVFAEAVTALVFLSRMIRPVG